ncbi:spore germination protein, partial [Paenibacillus sp. TAF58]
PLFSTIQENVDYVRQSLGNSTDIIIREFTYNAITEGLALLYTDGLADAKVVNDFMMRSLMADTTEIDPEQDPFDILTMHTLTIGEIQKVSDLKGMLHHILSGDSVILMNGYTTGLAAGTKGWKDRGVTETNVETVVRGPREAFSESIRTNTALIRRKIKDPNLWMETFQVGQVTQTDVVLMYVKGIALDSLILEARNRLTQINIDGIFESSNIEELIQDEVITPFPTVYNSERPDVVSLALIHGKVAILVDGTPFVLIAPALFETFLKASEDYYHRVDISTLVRILRYAGFLIALLAPSFYVAITTFHQEMLPTQLLISLAAQREGIPFPAFIEALLMEITFEVLREAALRMPRTKGCLVSFSFSIVIFTSAHR